MGVGAKTAMQMHYESRGYPGAEVEGESSCSAPVALGLLGLGSWKPQGQDVVPPASNVYPLYCCPCLQLMSN